MKTLLFIIVSVVGLIAMILLAIRIMTKIGDKRSTRAAKKYCVDNDLEFVEVNAFPNHYGLYFKKGNKKFYASFDFNHNGAITWKKGTPHEIVMSRLKK